MEKERKASGLDGLDDGLVFSLSLAFYEDGSPLSSLVAASPGGILNCRR